MRPSTHTRHSLGAAGNPMLLIVPGRPPHGRPEADDLTVGVDDDSLAAVFVPS